MCASDRHDFNIYTNSQFPDMEEIDRLPLKNSGNGQLLVADVGKALDSSAIQTNIVRVDGQHSVYLPILKQGGDSNTISIVNGVREPTQAISLIFPSRSRPPWSSTNRNL